MESLIEQLRTANRLRESRHQLTKVSQLLQPSKRSPFSKLYSQCRELPETDSAVEICRKWVKVKVKVHTLDIAPLRSESPPQKRSGMARVLKGFHSFTCTCTPTRSSAMGMSHTCLCLPSRSWYSFTDP